MEKIGIGLYGNNGGHQIQALLDGHPRARIAAVAEMDRSFFSENQLSDPNLKFYGSLEEMLCDENVRIVSLCSPDRSKQAEEAIFCMESGRHVYAEKPCALSERDLDRLIETSRRTGKMFREMAGTAFQQPASSLRDLVLSGALGEIVQVFVQKSYPYHDGRPQDEHIDGGLILQNGVHALRYIEHCTGIRGKEILAMETNKGNPVKDGGLFMAASMIMSLENGGVASLVVNYCNQKGFGSWGNEHLRVFGTKGFAEFTDGGRRTHVVIGDQDLGELKMTHTFPDYFDLYLEELLDQKPMPISLEDELHCTRMVIRAKEDEERRRKEG